MNALDEFLRQTPTAKGWEKVGVEQHHGVVIPLFALHSQKSCGIGEYPDLISMILWAKDLGLDTIQLLPLNDTGHSPSPYGALSAQALNPIHLGLSSLPFVDESDDLHFMLKEMQKLNSSTRIDYTKLHDDRTLFLKAYFNLHSKNLLSDPAYIHFNNENGWLKNYALFKSIKIRFLWEKWSEWPSHMRDPTPESLEQLYMQFEADIAFHSCIQYLCFQQMEEMKSFADRHSVILIGDIPILIDCESADVWLQRHLFDLSFTAGAPPDVYKAEGQNWGFPLFNWTAMKEQRYLWWKQRLEIAENFYSAYRIDHVVGFYRIFAIPPNSEPCEGHFIPENEALWLRHGDHILRELLSATTMLPIAEDLGTVPLEIKENLITLGICGTRVMRWERLWHSDGWPYIPLTHYNPLGLTTVSTHDSETLFQWWNCFQDDAIAYTKGPLRESRLELHYSSSLSAEMRKAILHDSHHTSTIFHVNPLQEYLAYIPDLVWEDPNMERINIPGTVSDENWSYKFAASVEEISNNTPLAEFIRSVIA